MRIRAYLCAASASRIFSSLAPENSCTFATLVELERGHARDAARAGGLLVLVDVDLDEDDVGHLLSELDEDGRDALARPAPRRREVDHHELVARVDERLVEVGLGRELRDAA